MAYIPRLNSNGISRSPYWYSRNPYYNAGYGMPNCTCYAWGRFWENADVNGDFSNRPALSTGNAQDWYNHSDGYSRGHTPALGAIACYAGGQYSGVGHVCVLEQENSDGTWLVSESAWNGFFFRASHSIQANGDYGYGGYTFQGFIYNPVSGGGSVSPAPDGWTFIPRLNNHGMRGNPYWYSLNPSYTVRHHPLPNCVTYCIGRVFEFMDWKRTYSEYLCPTFTTGNADTWWGYTQDGYERGQTPEIGAIICFSGGLGGHVMVVEEISADGQTLTCSASGYESQRYFYIAHVHWNGTTWQWNSRFTFQGFIYNPFVHGGGNTFQTRGKWFFKKELWNREEWLLQ